MRRITPEAIPELRFMPWLIVGLMGTGLLAAAAGRRVGLYAWVSAFLVGALAGRLSPPYRRTVAHARAAQVGQRLRRGEQLGSRPDKNWRESGKAGCEVSPPGRKWRLLW